MSDKLPPAECFTVVVAALRMLAIANAIDGMSRADAARAGGSERQSLCDAIKRYNAEGVVQAP